MSNGDKDHAERLATLNVPNLAQWALVVGAMGARGERIGGIRNKARIAQPSRFTVYLYGLEYEGQDAHITLTPGPEETTKFTYFHFTIGFISSTGGSHVFYQLVYDDADEIVPKLTTKLVTDPGKDNQKGRLKEAQEHNVQWANDQELLVSVQGDIILMVEQMKRYFGGS